MSIETELKLSIAPAAVARLRRHPLLASVQPERQRLANCYYDTADLDLLAARIALRHRRTARGWLLTVKSAEPAAGGLARRSEWEAASQPGVFDFSHVDDKRLRRRLGAWRPALQPAFTTDFQRTTWLLTPAPGVRIELALDRGAIRHGDREEPLSEIELELLDGPVSALFDLALALQADLPLRPEAASKAERGYRLFCDEPPQPVRAGKSPLAATMAPVAAYRAVAFDCVDQLLRNETGVRTQAGPEFLHQTRVAIRRLRSAIRLWSPLLPAAYVADYAPAWQAVGQALGDARNFDVLADETLPPLREALPREAGLVSLAAQITRRRQRANVAACRALTSPGFSRLVLAFAAATHALSDAAGGADNAVLAEFADRRLQRLVRRFRQEAADVSGAPEALHRLRIAGKRLRYALEFLSPVYRRTRVKRYLSALAALQGTLGRLNDLHVAETLLDGLPRKDGGVLLRAWIAGQRAVLAAGLPGQRKVARAARMPRRR